MYGSQMPIEEAAKMMKTAAIRKCLAYSGSKQSDSRAKQGISVGAGARASAIMLSGEGAEMIDIPAVQHIGLSHRADPTGTCIKLARDGGPAAAKSGLIATINCPYLCLECKQQQEAPVNMYCYRHTCMNVSMTAKHS